MVGWAAVGAVGDQFEYMGGVIVGDPAVVSWDHDRLDVFVIGTDGALYHKAGTDPRGNLR